MLVLLKLLELKSLNAEVILLLIIIKRFSNVLPPPLNTGGGLTLICMDSDQICDLASRYPYLCPAWLKIISK